MKLTFGKVSIPFKRDGVSKPLCLLNPSVRGYHKPRSKRDSNQVFFSSAGSAKKRKNPCPLFVINDTINESEMSNFF